MVEYITKSYIMVVVTDDVMNPEGKYIVIYTELGKAVKYYRCEL